MKGYFPHLLVSLSLAFLNEATPSKTHFKDVFRNKTYEGHARITNQCLIFPLQCIQQRSILMDTAHKHHKGLPEFTKKSKSPHFGLHKRNDLDTLDLDALFADPFFADLMAEEAEDAQHFPNTFPEFEPILEPKFEPKFESGPVLPHKDEMSNVIPGALGPLEAQPRGGRVQEVSGKMLDDFLWFLELKESGLLDKCMMYKRR